jgi:hypothetical protein
LIGIGDHARANDDSLMGFQLDFQGHGRSPLPLLRPAINDCGSKVSTLMGRVPVLSGRLASNPFRSRLTSG